MTTTSGSPQGPGQDQGQHAPPAEEAIGGEVRIGRGGGVAWLRYWYYLVYLWMVLYLVGTLVVDDMEYAWIVAAFAGMLTAWLVYIAWRKKPPEP